LHQHELHAAEQPILVLSIAVVAWYAGLGPTVLAVALGALAFAYYLAEPSFSFDLTSEGQTDLGE